MTILETKTIDIQVAMGEGLGWRKSERKAWVPGMVVFHFRCLFSLASIALEK